MIESNSRLYQSKSHIPEYSELPLLYHSIADSLLYKTKHLAQLKASQNEELNKLFYLEKSTKKRKIELETKTIKYEEYGVKIQSNRLK